MEPIEISIPISYQVASIIRSDIFEGKLKAGEKISANKICRQMNISATPVREAFKILQTEGLIKILPRSGTVVSEYAIQSIRDMAYIRASLEGDAAYIASHVATDEELNNMNKILEKSGHAAETGNLADLIVLNTAFHRSIRLASQNQYLIMQIDRLMSYDYTIRKTALSDVSKRIKGVREHRIVLDYMMARDAENAEKAIIRHIRETAYEIILTKDKEGET